MTIYTFFIKYLQFIFSLYLTEAYDGNSGEILTCTAGVGWHEKESKAETQVHGALKAAYYDAYHAARQEINGMEVQGGFDARA